MVAIGTRPTPRASRAESLRFNLAQTLPQFLRGPFRERPRVGSFLARHHPDAQGIRTVRRLRERHGDYVWVDLLGKPSLLVLDVEGVREVLERSPDVFGPPEMKVRGMSHFQPGAVTISSGDAWGERRRFNEAVLASGTRVHPGSAGLLGTVAAEVERTLGVDRHRLEWTELEGLFRRLASGVVFGRDAPGAEAVLDDLDGLMAESNRIFGLSRSDRLDGFQERIRTLVCRTGAGGLSAAACPHLEPGDPLPVAGQVPHWLFALEKTLAVNCANALALLHAHPAALEEARREAAGADLSDPAEVDAMDFLERSLQETMRLLPTTPLIIRRAVRDYELKGHPVAAEAQVLIHNGYLHRSPAARDDPDRFRPDAWDGEEWSYRFNHLSNGPQACAGRALVLLLGKAVVGRLLRPGRWTLRRPRVLIDGRVPHALDHRSLLLERGTA